MKVTVDNVDDIKFIYDFKNRSLKESKNLLISLLVDIAGMNALLIDDNKSDKQIFIDYENKHTEYSPERTDPCPDYYGMYRLWQGNKTLGIEMDLEVLDYVLAVLNDIFEDDY